MQRSHAATIGALLVVTGVVGIFAFQSLLQNMRDGHQEDTAASKLQPDDDFPYTDMDGNQVDLRAYEGSVLVINTWASWCPFCARELSEVDRIAGEYTDTNVAVLAINRAEPTNTVNAFLEYIGKPQQLTILLDPSDTFYSMVGGYAMPETVVYGKDGSEAAHIRGVLGPGALEELIKEALAEEQ